MRAIFLKNLSIVKLFEGKDNQLIFLQKKSPELIKRTGH